jgi:hypothetical protein
LLVEQLVIEDIEDMTAPIDAVEDTHVNTPDALAEPEAMRPKSPAQILKERPGLDIPGQMTVKEFPAIVRMFSEDISKDPKVVVPISDGIIAWLNSQQASQIRPDQSEPFMNEVLGEMDRDLGGIIALSEWEEYCFFAVQNIHVKDVTYVNKLDEQLQQLVVKCCEDCADEPLECTTRIIMLFGIFDDNNSARMTVDEFNDGLMELGLLPHNFYFHGVMKQYSPSSLGLFPPSSTIRRYCAKLAMSTAFDNFILLAIIANSVVLALSDYQDVGMLQVPEQPNGINSVVGMSEYIFNAIFTLEFIVRVITMGFYKDTGSYLRDAWNWLDFVVVVIGIVGMIPGLPQLSSIRTFRVLRPLRTLSSLPGMRVLVGALLTSLPMMLDVVMILMFVFAIFGVLGVQLWNGKLHSYCRATPWPDPDTGLWAYGASERVCGGHFTCPIGGGLDGAPPEYCGNEFLGLLENGAWTPLPEGTFITHRLPPENVAFGYTNFDNIGFALLTIFQCITMEGWVEVMYKVQDGSNWGFCFFFILLIIFGSFFLMELIFAVIFDKFTKCHDLTKPPENSLALEKLKELKSTNALELKANARENATENGTENATDKSGKVVPEGQSDEGDHSLSGLFHGAGKGMYRPDMSHQEANESGSLSTVRFYMKELVDWKYFQSFITGCIILNTMFLAMNEYPENEAKVAVLDMGNFILTIVFTIEMVLKLGGLGLRRYVFDYSSETYDEAVKEAKKEARAKAKEEAEKEAEKEAKKEPEQEPEKTRAPSTPAVYPQSMGYDVPSGCGFNAFDGTIVCVSMFEIIVAAASGGEDEGGGAISALRAFRLFRIFKLVRSWVTLANLLRTIAKTVLDVGNFFLLLVLFMYIFALVGMQFFANKFKFDEVTLEAVDWEPFKYTGTDNATMNHPPWSPEMPYYQPRSNFDDLGFAVLTVFQVLTAEDWNLIMYDGIRAIGMGGALYFVVLQCVGNMVVLSLFLAILLNNFSKIEEFDNDEVVKEVAVPTQWKAVKSALKMTSIVGKVVPSDSDGHEVTQETMLGFFGKDHKTKLEVEKVEKADNLLMETQENGKRLLQKRLSAMDLQEAAVKEAKNHPSLMEVASTADRGGEIEQKSPVPKGVIAKAQYYICKVIKHPHFDNTVLSLIFISSVLLAIDNPLNDPDSLMFKIIKVVDLILTIAFILEMTLKIAGLGMRAYWGDGWNTLDGTIVIISIVNLSAGDGGGSLKSLKSLRALRALRPLRVISRAPGLKQVVNTMLAAIPNALNVILVVVLFYLIFGILATDWFKGKFFSCNIGDFDSEVQKRIEREYGLYKQTYQKPFLEADCVAFGGEMTNADANFDNVLHSMITLFEMSTTEGWIAIMLMGIDASGEKQHPVENFNRPYALFFVLFMIVGCFFALNLFVGAVIDAFNDLKKDDGDSSLFLTDQQREWVETQQMMARAKLKVRPDPPTGFLRMKCFRLADNSYIEGEYFEKFIMLCITLNTVVMACVAYNESDAKAAFIENANFAFAAIFLVEAVIKIFALHLLYFKSGWNCFDFSIVCMTILFTMLEAFAGIDVSSLANLARAFRMCLIIRLFKNAKAMQSLTNTILMNLPAMGNITALLSLVLFIYTVMGVQLFAQVLSPQEELMDLVNFQSFGNAALLLFRCLTGEAWNSIMYGLMVQEKHDWTDVYSPDDGSFVHWINPAGEISTDPNTPWIGLSATGTSCHPDSVAWPLTYKDIVAARTLNNDENFAIGCSPGNPMVYIFFFTFQTITQLIALNLFIGE